MRNKRLLDVFVAVFVLANVVDLITTIIGIEFYGAVELNPVMASAASRGLLVFAIAKLCLVGCICALLRLRFHVRPKVITTIAALASVTFLYVSIRNIIIIASQH